MLCVPHKKACATPSPHEDKWRQTFQSRPQLCSRDRRQSLVPEAPTVWMTICFSLLSRQPNVRHHHLSHVFERVSHVLNLLQHVGVSCPRISTYLTLPCLCLNQRCCVSKLRQVYKPLGQLQMFPARLHLFIYFLVFLHPTRQHSSVTSRTSHVSFRAALRSYSSFPSLPSPSRISLLFLSFTLSLHFDETSSE